MLSNVCLLECICLQTSYLFWKLLNLNCLFVFLVFGPICSPSSGGRVYNVANGTCCTSKTSDCGAAGVVTQES
jgi:hypothetical protein